MSLACFLAACAMTPEQDAMPSVFRSLEVVQVKAGDCWLEPGYQWEDRNTAARLALWAVPRDDWRVIGPYAAITERIGDIAIVYARTTFEKTSEALKRHEFCHVEGIGHQVTRAVHP